VTCYTIRGFADPDPVGGVVVEGSTVASITAAPRERRQSFKKKYKAESETLLADSIKASVYCNNNEKYKAPESKEKG
jgi:hypothetical protein